MPTESKDFSGKSVKEKKMAVCELLSVCGFFQKYENSLNMACKGFITTYCKGPQMDECKRKIYRQEHGVPPDDDMMPTGQQVPETYRG